MKNKSPDDLPVAPKSSGCDTKVVSVAEALVEKQRLSDMVLGGVATNAYTAMIFTSESGDVSMVEAMKTINASIGKLRGGNMESAEAMLMSQAISLNAIHAELARRAHMSMGSHMDSFERYLRLALKTQNQCRATLDTLANIRRPAPVFAKQANISHGPQQVNNGIQLAATRIAPEHVDNAASVVEAVDAATVAKVSAAVDEFASNVSKISVGADRTICEVPCGATLDR